ncbi:methyltransferase [Bacteroides phage BT528P2]|nr:methyltransferase [Bacteroides phage BT498P1]WAX09318.1 methyltransferase [Bacteroides phage BT528P1]WAX09364.1 methyltransferase [Bacteroides phage BT528P2]
MNVLSLFDGMSCGQIALYELGMYPDKYYACEIDKFAIAQTKLNFPDTIFLGDVTKLDVSKLDKIDLLMGGSPCQSFSFAGKRVGMSTESKEEVTTLAQYMELKEKGFQFVGQSYLFWEYMRILTDIRKYNPNVLFLLENVEMGKKWERVLSEAIGVDGVHINSALVSAQNRKRIYWTNIRTRGNGRFSELQSDIPQPADKGILLKDILEDEVDEKYYLSNKVISGIMDRIQGHAENVRVKGFSYTDIASHVGMIVEGENPLNKRRKANGMTLARGIIQLNPSKASGGVQPYQQDRIYDVNGIAPALCSGHGGMRCNVNTDRIRRLTPTECARLQTIPYWYKWECSDTQAYKMLGNGWTVAVIYHILSFIK